MNYSKCTGKRGIYFDILCQSKMFQKSFSLNICITNYKLLSRPPHKTNKVVAFFLKISVSGGVLIETNSSFLRFFSRENLNY